MTFGITNTSIYEGNATLPKNYATLQMTIQISGALSVAGSLFIIISWFIFRMKTESTFSRKLIMYISVADFFAGATFFFSGIDPNIKPSVYKPTDSCVAQGYMLQFFFLAGNFWTACFAYHLYILIVKGQGRSVCKQMERTYHIISWGFPAFTVVFLFIERYIIDYYVMGFDDRPWCWIRTWHPQNGSHEGPEGNEVFYVAGAIQQFVFFYIPVVIIFAYNAYVYIVLTSRTYGHEMAGQIRRRLIMYLLVFAICAVWGLLHRFYQLFSPEHETYFPLSLLDAIFSPLQGFLNALVYGVIHRMIERYRTLCCGPPANSTLDINYQYAGMSNGVGASGRSLHYPSYGLGSQSEYDYIHKSASFSSTGYGSYGASSHEALSSDSEYEDHDDYEGQKMRWA